MQQSGPTAAPSAGAPLVGWGAAVHGSSAFLQATTVEPQQGCSASVSGAHGQAAHFGQPCQNQIFPSSWPDNSNGPAASTQSHSWHQSCGGAGLTASQPHPPDPTTWPQLAHLHQHPAYVPQLHGLQQPNYLPHPQQYAWESYHAHSAMAGMGATNTTGAPMAAAARDGWYGWSSHYGARPHQPYPHPGAMTPSPPHLKPPGLRNGGGDGVPGASPNGSGTPAAQAPIETGDGVCGGDEAYDPLADVDVDAPDQTAADPKAGVSSPGRLVTAAAAASIYAERSGGQAAAKHADGDDAASLALVRAAETAPVEPPTTVALAQSVDLIVVWDLDETLIIFNSLLSGAFARAIGASAVQGDAVAAAAAAPAAAAPVAAACCGPSASGSEGHSPSPSSSPLADRAAALGQQLADLVFNFCDDHLSFQQLDSTDPQSFMELWALAATAGSPATTVEAEAAAAAAATTAAAATAGRACASAVQRASLERIAQVYGGGAEGLPDVIGQAGCRTLSVAMAEAERLTGGWVAAARRLLAGVTAAAAAFADGASTAASACQGTWPVGGATEAAAALTFRRVRHVLVSAGHLVATLGKLLLWGLDEHFDIRDVYSASGRPKLEVFRYLRARYGPNSAFAAVGDGLEEERAAAVLGWGFVRVALAETAAQPAAAVAQAGAATAAAGVGAGVGSGLPESRAGSAVQQLARAAARPLGAIQPEDVLAAARQAYYD